MARSCGPSFTLQDWNDLITQYTTDVETLPSFNNDDYIGEYKPRYERLLRAPTHPDPFTLVNERSDKTGRLLYTREVLKAEEQKGLDKNVRSLTCRPLQQMEVGARSALGSSNGMHFRPGGLSDDEEGDEQADVNTEDFTSNLLSVPPGFHRGLEFTAEDKAAQLRIDVEMGSSDIQGLITKLDELMIQEQERKKAAQEDNNSPSCSSDTEEDFTAEVPSHRGRYQWAKELDAESEVDDFYTKIGNLAYQFPFELDPFQKQAILKLHSHDNVMVAAHTSAGKTVVAEYAIALSLHHMTKVIYTSPIKALSNQKFRDFKEKFGDVGLLTGDIQINTTAPCLIMTTEILRSMLYNGSDTTRDLEWVVFDEVHYIDNVDRGVVWEEVLIMLPEHVSVILLSATVANVTDFAEWVGNTKRKNVYVIKTPRRPVPLEHHLYTGTSDKTSKQLFKIISANDKNFKTDEFEKAKTALESRKKKNKNSNSYDGRGGFHINKTMMISFVRMLERENLLPAVIFILSKNGINTLADGLSGLDLTTNKEKGFIGHFFESCIAKLSPGDRELGQIKVMRDLVTRGIAKHHSGVLPLMKEVTEMLFEKGYIKLLLATDTFAMGINMPTRTVVFNGLMKHDGQKNRFLETSEYIQMAGRAGRRGKDETGTVIILCEKQIPDHKTLTRVVQGNATDLSSHFKPTYNMILSVLKGGDLRVEEILKRSFAEYEKQVKSRDYVKERKVLEAELANLAHTSCTMCGNIELFYEEGLRMIGLENDFKKNVLTGVSKNIHPGRVIGVSTVEFPFHVAVVVDDRVQKNYEDFIRVLVIHTEGYSSGLKTDGGKEEDWERVVTSLKMSPGVNNRTTRDLMLPDVDDPSFSVCDITTQDITSIFKQKVTSDMKELRDCVKYMKHCPQNSDHTLVQTLAREVVQIPTLEEIRYETAGLADQINAQRGVMARFSCTQCISFDDHIRKTGEIMFLKSKLDDIAYLLSYQSLQFMPEFEKRVKVLKRLGYLDADDQLKLKGKAACAMSTSELVITELVFDNFFKDLDVKAIVAILSCMVFQDRKAPEPELSTELAEAKANFLALARRITDAEAAEKLQENLTDPEEMFRFGLVEAVWRWANGEPFSHIMEMMEHTKVDEGSVVKCIMRLDEVLRCIKDVARIVGDVDFELKMESASLAIKRDIVFAASLYVRAE